MRMKKLLLDHLGSYRVDNQADLANQLIGQTILLGCSDNISHKRVKVVGGSLAVHTGVGYRIMGGYHTLSAIGKILCAGCYAKEVRQVLAEGRKTRGVARGDFRQQDGEKAIDVVIACDHVDRAVHDRTETQASFFDHLA